MTTTSTERPDEIADHAHLVDGCPGCGTDTIPYRAEQAGRRWVVCAYLCQACGKRWSCGWDPSL